MANDRYCFLVLEESLPEGTIAKHRKSRSKPERHSRTGRRWWRKDGAVVQARRDPRKSPL
jgi:hypothetical protein